MIKHTCFARWVRSDHKYHTSHSSWSLIIKVLGKIGLVLPLPVGRTFWLRPQRQEEFHYEINCSSHLHKKESDPLILT